MSDAVAERFRVTHRTQYRYDAPVVASFGHMHLFPRTWSEQTCMSTAVTFEPEPEDYRERIDYFGNRTAYFAVRREHRALVVTTESIVSVHRRPAPARSDGPSWTAVRELLSVASRGRSSEPTDLLTPLGPLDDDLLAATEQRLESPLIAQTAGVHDYAAASFVPGTPLVDAVVDLSHRVHRDFKYKPGATSVTTTLDEVLERRAGVCQDFSHLMIGCLRSVGLAARYVSGYLETRPPPGRPRLQGVDQSHAWVSAYVPPLGWLDIDPTNDQWVDDRYVANGWGRDYGDVPPLKGVIYTEGGAHEPDVSVDVVRLGSPAGAASPGEEPNGGDDAERDHEPA